MSKHIVYLTDLRKFYDTLDPRGGPMTYEKALTRMAQYDPKYEDRVTATVALEEAKLAGVTYQEAKQSKRTGRELNWSELYEAFREHIPIRFRKNLKGQTLAYVVRENNEVTKVQFASIDNLKDALMARELQYIWQSFRRFHATTELLEGHRNKVIFSMFIMKMLNEMLYDERLVLSDEPVSISWDESELAYKKMDASLLVPGPTPTWDEFLARLDYPEVFKAWVWAIFEPTNNIRQIMWLRGAGADGKSSVQKAIESVIGRDHCYSMKENDEAQQWFQNNVYTKVLVNYADCRYQYLLSKSSIKQLTGGDTTSIEGKGENAFTGKIYAKLFVTSNTVPKINPELRAHTSRLIKLDVMPPVEAKKDAGFENRLKNEIYAMLWQCREAYSNHISAGGNELILPEDLRQKMMAECASDSYMHLRDFFDKYVQLGEDFMCKPSELNKALQNFIQLEKNLPSGRLNQYMEEFNQKLELVGASLQRVELDTGLETMYVGFRLKNENA